MAGLEEKLGPKREAAIAALLTQRNVEEAARVANVAPRTLYRWLKEPAFAAAYREAQRAVFSQALARLQQLAGAAVSTLGKVMVDANTPASSRVRAAFCVLDQIAKAIQQEELAARVSELERILAASNPARRNR